MNSELLNFLEKHPKKNRKFTHTIPGKGSWLIPDDKLNAFYNLVHDSIFIHNDKYMLVEKIQDITTFVVDLDLHWTEKYDTRQYTKETVNELTKFMFSIMSDYLKLDDTHYNIMVMEKDNIRTSKKTNLKSKDGIHLVFPKIQVSKELYRHFIELIYENEDVINKIFEDTCINPPNNSVKDIFDKSIYSTNWMVYGCYKKEEIEDDIRYKLTRIFNISGGDNILESPLLDIYLDSPLDIIKLNSVSKKDKSVDYTELAENYLSTKNLNNSIQGHTIMDNMAENNDIDPNVTQFLNKKKYELVRTLVDNLDDSRASDWETWLKLGFILYNFDKSPESYKIWEDFSKRYDKYRNGTSKRVKAGGCRVKWYKEFKSQSESITIKTLHWWVMQDIPREEYEKIKKDSLAGKIEKSLEGEKSTGAHYDVASVICDYYSNEFICSGLKENFWYYFDENEGGRWIATEVGHELRKKLSNEIVDIYMYYMDIFQKAAKTAEIGGNLTLKKVNDILVANCGKIIAKLKDSTYKDKIIRECRELFYDPEFNDKINSNFDLLGFDNGVFDLNKMEFRKGQPDDFVTISTKYPMPIDNFNKPIKFEELYKTIINDKNNKQLIRDMDLFIEQVLPNRKSNMTYNWDDDHMRNYVLRFLSSCLSGNVREEKFYFWTGSGGNGKSKLVELLDFALGDYSKTLDVAYLTTKRGSSSSASPEVETLKYARFVTCSEPEEEDKIYVGKLKQITGGDKLTTRGLYKETTEFKPQFKIILMCNDLPKLQNQDGGTWRRIEVVQFPSRFGDGLQATEEDPNQFEADLNLSAKLETWKLLFILKLLSHYKIYSEIDPATNKPRGTDPPDEVKRGTDQYKAESDIITSWFNNDIVECELNEDGIAPTHIDSIFDWFKEWCSNEGLKKNIPPKKKVREAMIKYQEKSEAGATWGRNKANGTKNSPYFTFKLIT